MIRYRLFCDDCSAEYKGMQVCTDHGNARREVYSLLVKWAKADHWDAMIVETAIKARCPECKAYELAEVQR